MAKRRRCTECRRWFSPAATTDERQKTCGPECRRSRRRKQARARRAADLEGSRAEECARQQVFREARRKQRSEEPRHAPASPRNYPEVLEKVRQIVDEASRLSRTGFERAVRQILREIGSIVDGVPARAGTSHGVSRAGFGVESRENAEENERFVGQCHAPASPG